MSHSARIPYRAYWSTPFARWQGALSHLNSVEFAARVAAAELGRRGIPPEALDYGVLGLSVPQKHSFYGLPWLAGMAGLGHLAGPTVMQACATGVRVLLAGVQEIESGMATAALGLCCDRTSNGPHIYYPNPKGPGGTGAAENWVMDNFGCDPLGPHSMLQTAENVARAHGISTAEQHEVVLRREAQYRDALADDRAFLRRFMTLPFAVPDAAFRRTVAALEGDEGVSTSTAEGLAKLRPAMEGGSVTFGGQTHPADGNAAIIITRGDRAGELSADKAVKIRILGVGQARAKLAYMPEAPFVAAKSALEQADLSFDDLDAIKTHNPFAVNDIIFSREAGIDLGDINNFGCSLIWGHPQAPTGMRLIIELIEELVLRGGGRGLFTGCAAGDTAMALVVCVGGS